MQTVFTEEQGCSEGVGDSDRFPLRCGTTTGVRWFAAKCLSTWITWSRWKKAAQRQTISDGLVIECPFSW